MHLITINRRFARQNDEHELNGRIFLFQVAKYLLHLLYVVGVFAKARLIHVRHAGVGAYALQLLGEIAQRRLVADSGWRETSNGPCVYADARMKLLASHVPHAQMRQHC